ncbi:uncharacterized protein (TIGR04255 family) [Luteococcus japonicus]|uniref:Uncharacterized protein (TIGR04255 family) n=1 Tax=Luteococcus japonicus TaxID=33984 RepID=A0A3N1ZWE6_9ACTN|nr:TIGR04255 family protein [Luteococcus japonicus]ROR55181.1 uncharacterized protein (TIGR04255 family) [Luteococcus japonicus]
MSREKWRPFTNGAELTQKPDGRDLAMVLWQVRWAELASLRDDKLFMAAVDRLGDAFAQYPFYQHANEIQLQITPLGVTQTPGSVTARWESTDREWLVIVSAQSFTLCKLGAYESFDIFAERVTVLLEDLIRAFAVPEIERVGVRYVNRLQGDALNSLHTVFPKREQPRETLSEEVTVMESVCTTTMQVSGIRFNVRSGMIPPGQTVDPAILPMDQVSWVLDLDATLEKRMPPTVDDIVATAGRLADLNYDYYLWARGATRLNEQKEVHGDSHR